MLNINSKNLCEHCFAEISGKSGKCPFCSYPKNNEKYPTSLPEGTILAGRYVVGRVLGKGGFGVTYLCYDSKDKTRVAIKEYLPDSLTHRNTGETQVSTYGGESEEYFKTGAQKFYDEAKLVSRFNGNPNIISVYEFFYENNTTYFVMEYLDGIDLKHYIKEKGGKISEAEVIYIALKITEALMIVHSTDVLHRDISPDNIFLCNDGKVKLIDFGAARQVVGEASKSLSVILKQGFAPLEQYQKRGKQGPWTDIYALGASLYYALTGEILDDAMSRITDDNVSFEGISPDFAQILEKMLAVRKEDRYQNTFELKAELSSLAIAPKAFEAKAPETPAVTECLPEVKKEIVEEKAEPLKNEEKKINVGGIAKKTIAKLQENIKSNSEKASDSDKKKKIITVILIFLLAAGLIIGYGLVIAEFFSFGFYAEKANSFLRFAVVVEGVLVFIAAVILSAVILKDKTDSSSRNKLKKILISVCSVAVIVPVITNILSFEIAYQEACSYLDAEFYGLAMRIFREDLGGYKDSETKYKESAYRFACEMLEGDSSWEFETAKELFEKIGDYEDSEEKAIEAAYRDACFEFENAKQAISLERAAEQFEELGNYKDSKEKAKAAADKLAFGKYKARGDHVLIYSVIDNIFSTRGKKLGENIVVVGCGTDKDEDGDIWICIKYDGSYCWIEGSDLEVVN